MRGSRIPETRRARVLRQSQTHTETVVWRALRGRGLGGVKFVRQEPIGPYFADFVCRDKKLVVEIAGATHSTEAELRNDARRTEFLCAHGSSVWSNSQMKTSIGTSMACLKPSMRGSMN